MSALNCALKHEASMLKFTLTVRRGFALRMSIDGEKVDTYSVGDGFSVPPANAPIRTNFTATTESEFCGKPPLCKGRWRSLLRRKDCPEAKLTFQHTLFHSHEKTDDWVENLGSSVHFGAIGYRHALKRLISQSFSAFCASSLKNISAVSSSHSFSEAVLFFSLSLFGLICSEHYCHLLEFEFGSALLTSQLCAFTQ